MRRRKRRKQRETKENKTKNVLSYRLFSFLSESGAKAARAGTGDAPLQKPLARSTGTTGSQVLPPPLGMSPANVSASSLADRKSVTPGTENRKRKEEK